MSQYKDQITGDIITNIRATSYSIINYTNDNTTTYDTSIGSITVSSDQTKFSSKSLYFNDNNRNVLNIYPSNLKVDGDFTCSFWVYQPTKNISDTNAFTHIGFGWESDTAGSLNSMPIYISISTNLSGYNTRAGRIQAYRKGSNIINTEISTISFDSWHHYAVVRTGSTVKVFVDGVQIGSVGNTLQQYWNTNMAEIVLFNDSYGGSVTYPFYVDDFVFINGQALWTNNFTPPDNYLLGNREFAYSNQVWPVRNIPTITGDVILNIRSVGDKIVDYSPVRANMIYIENNVIETSITKYSDYGINLINRGYLGVYKNIPMNQFTLSFWFNMLQYDNNGATFIGMGRYDDSGSITYLIREGNNTTFLDWRLLSYNSYNFRTYKSSFNYSTNTWYHIAITFDGTYYKVYENGILIITANYPYEFGSARAIEFLNSIKTAYDDIVLINNQVLWTDNFSPPNDLLLGRDYKPHRAYKKNIIWPINARQGDYFDKAYLY